MGVQQQTAVEESVQRARDYIVVEPIKIRENVFESSNIEVATEGQTRIHIKAHFKDTSHRHNTSILNRAQLIAFAHLTGGLVPSLVDANHAFWAGDCSVGADNVIFALGAKQLAGSRRG